MNFISGQATTNSNDIQLNNFPDISFKWTMQNKGRLTIYLASEMSKNSFVAIYSSYCHSLELTGKVPGSKTK